MPISIQTAAIGAVQLSAPVKAGSSTSKIGIVSPPITDMKAGIMNSTPKIGISRCLMTLNSSRRSLQEEADHRHVHGDVHAGEQQARAWCR